MSRPDENAIRADILRQVESQVEFIAAASPSSEVADNLVTFGLQLVDGGWSAALGPVFAAFERVRSASLAREVDLGWYSMLLGLYDFHGGRFQEARDEFGRAVSISKAVNDADLTANSMQNLGNVLWMSGDLDGAEAAFVDSNEVRPPADEVGRAKVLVDLASIYLDRREPEKLRTILDELSASSAMRRRGADTSALLGLKGLQAVREGQLRAAEALFRRGAEMARRRGIVLHEIPNLQNLGSVRVELRSPGKALRPLRRAVRLASLIQDYRMLETGQRTLAMALAHIRRHREAEAVLIESAAIVGDGAGVLARARVVADLGSLYLEWQKPDTAIAPLRTALDAFLAAGDQGWGPKTALNLALALRRTGSNSQALEVVRETGTKLFDDPDEVGELLETLGDVASEQGIASDRVSIYRAAIEEYGKRHTRNLSDRFAEMGSKLAEARMHSEAVGFYDEAVRRYDPHASQLALYQILNDRGLSRAGAGDLALALEDLEESLALARLAEDRAMQALCLGNVSEIARRSEDYQRAVAMARASVAVARELRNGLQISDALAQLGLAQLSADELDGAMASFREALRLGRSAANRSAEAIALGGLGQIANARGQQRRAIGYFLEAVEIEATDTDATHETETWGAITESAARLRDEGRYESSMQRLIDSVQKREGPLSVALASMEATGAAWLEKGDVEHAGDAFAIAILLSAAESVGLSHEQFIEIVARSVLAPFYSAKRLGRDLDALERPIRAALRRHLGRSARRIEALIPMAREALEPEAR